MEPSRRRFVLQLAGVILFFAACRTAAHLLLISQMKVPWHLLQFLDREALREHPVASLLLLHVQPPLFNTLTALLLGLADRAGVTLETFARPAYVLVGLATAFLLFRLTLRATSSLLFAALSLVLLLADPGFYWFSATFFDPLLLELLLTALLLVGWRYVEEGRRTDLFLAASLLVLASLTNPLYSPLWALGFYALLVLGRGHLSAPRSGAERRRWLLRAVLPGPALLLLLLAWPLKNAIVFDRFTASSWSGTTMNQGDVGNPVFSSYFRSGLVPAETAARLATFERTYGKGRTRALAVTEKSIGGRNWNHLVVLDTSEAIEETAGAWRWQHPGLVLEHAVHFYLCWTLPTYWNTYTSERLGPPEKGWARYAEVYEAGLYTDLRPLLASAKALLVNRGPEPPKRRMPYTLFGVVLFPLVILLAVSFLVQRRPWVPGSRALLLALYNVGWLLVVPCLGDGYEGNRIRYALGPHLIFALCLLASSAAGRLARWRRRGRDAH
jgi:hypothetical protein